MKLTEKTLKGLLLNKSFDWGQTICIHNGPTYYFDKHIIMSSKSWPKRSYAQSFKTLYVDKGLGTLHYISKLKNITKTFELEPGFSISILPNDIFSIDCIQDLFIFETGTVRKNDEVLC